MQEKTQNNTKISCKAILLCSTPSQETTWNGSFVLPAMVADLQLKSVENLRTGITASLWSRPCIFHVNYFLGTAKLSLRRKWRHSFWFLCYVFPWFSARLPPFSELRVFLFLTLASSFATVSIRCMFPALDTVTRFPALRKGFLFFSALSKELFPFPVQAHGSFFTQGGSHWVLSYTTFYWVNMISFTDVSGKR